MEMRGEQEVVRDQRWMLGQVGGTPAGPAAVK